MKKYTVNAILMALIAILSVALLSGCGFSRPENLKMISATELKTIISQDDILLIDVHIPEQEHIKNTSLFAPFYKIDDYLEQLPSDKNAAIYLYCKSGPMANWAARTLFDLGYTNIYNLEGGKEAWNDMISAATNALKMGAPKISAPTLQTAVAPAESI